MSTYLLLIAGTEAMLLMASGIIVFVVIYQKRLVHQQEEKQQLELTYRREMNEAGIRVAESERRRIATDLHDDIGHALLALRMQLHAGAGTNENTRLIDTTLEKVRHIAYDLYPPGLSMFGLAHALNDLLTETCPAASIAVHSDFTRLPSDLDPETELALYRIVQELLSNTIRYAQATQIVFYFEQTSPKLVMHYHDNGCGFDAGTKEKGLGLLNMQNRALAVGGNLKIITAPGKEFKAELTLPVPIAAHA